MLCQWQRHGSGTYTYADGSEYEGAWEQNRRDGQGTMTYADGSVYRGSFMSDKVWLACWRMLRSCRAR